MEELIEEATSDSQDEEESQEDRVARLKADCDELETQLRGHGLDVNTGRVNIADLRVFATGAAALRLLQAKGLVTVQEIDLTMLSILHEFMANVLEQIKTQIEATHGPSASAHVTPRKAKKSAAPSGLLPVGSRSRMRRRQD